MIATVTATAIATATEPRADEGSLAPFAPIAARTGDTSSLLSLGYMIHLILHIDFE